MNIQQRLVLKKDPKQIQNPLYNGGIFKDQAPPTQIRISDFSDGFIHQLWYCTIPLKASIIVFPVEWSFLDCTFRVYSSKAKLHTSCHYANIDAVHCVSYQETFFQTSFFEFYNVGCSLRCVQFPCKAVWVKIHGADSTPVTASLMADNNSTYDCVGTVLPRMDAGHFSREDSFLMHLQVYQHYTFW